MQREHPDRAGAGAAARRGVRPGVPGVSQFPSKDGGYRSRGLSLLPAPLPFSPRPLLQLQKQSAADLCFHEECGEFLPEADRSFKHHRKAVPRGNQPKLRPRPGGHRLLRGHPRRQNGRTSGLWTDPLFFPSAGHLPPFHLPGKSLGRQPDAGRDGRHVKRSGQREKGCAHPDRAYVCKK